MEKRERYTEEGIFISDFTDDFFKRRLESEQGLEGIVQRCSGRVMALWETGERGLWHPILKGVLEEICKVGLDDYFRNGKETENFSGLQRIMFDFYREPFFLELDVAQAITYNLYRLERTDNYNMEEEESIETWKDQYREFLDFGRNMAEKDFTVDLLPGLKRIAEKYGKNGRKEKVMFLGLEGDKEIILESAFAELNVLYIGNEKFRDYLYWKERIRNGIPRDSSSSKKM